MVDDPVARDDFILPVNLCKVGQHVFIGTVAVREDQAIRRLRKKRYSLRAVRQYREG
jgi:hypothetical protein